MPAFFLALLMFIVLVSGMVWFIIWSIREHVLANRWRALMSLHADRIKSEPEEVRQPHFKITYKSGKETKTIIANGTTEGAALLEAAKSGIRYDKIISITKG